MVDLSINIGQLKLKNPLMTASGTFGYGTEYQRYMNIEELGGLITKTITLEHRKGNPLPRIAETPCGMLNSIGLANVGVKRFIQEKLPALEGLNTAIIVNIAGSHVDEYFELVKRLSVYDRIDAFEVNISCPNVKKGGLAFGTEPEVTRDIIAGIRGLTQKPVIAKLTPNVTDITAIAKAAVEGGANGLSLINTVLGMGIDIRTKKPLLGRVVGGLSGPAIKPIALAKVYQVSQVVQVPIIGIGGIRQWTDVIEFFLAGATGVQIGTWTFVEPSWIENILNGINGYCQEHGIQTISDLVGTLNIDEN